MNFFRRMFKIKKTDTEEPLFSSLKQILIVQFCSSSFPYSVLEPTKLKIKSKKKKNK